MIEESSEGIEQALTATSLGSHRSSRKDRARARKDFEWSVVATRSESAYMARALASSNTKGILANDSCDDLPDLTSGSSSEAPDNPSSPSSSSESSKSASESDGETSDGSNSVFESNDLPQIVFVGNEVRDELAVIDTGCTRTIIGDKPLKRLAKKLHSLGLKIRLVRKVTKCRFGNGGILLSNFIAQIPCGLTVGMA